MADLTVPSQEEFDRATRSAEDLGVPPDRAALGTRTAVASGGQTSRFYHDGNHFGGLIAGARECEQILIARGVSPQVARVMADAYRVAARDHDTVYAGPDGGIPADIRTNVDKFVEHTDKGGYQIRSAEALAHLSAEEQKNARIAMETFGYKPGQTLNPFSGQNEFLSTLHSLEANPGMSSQAKLAVASMVESTIPFRNPGSADQLAERVAAQHMMTPEESRAVALASAHFANRDVAAFAGPVEQFRQNTHDLMREAGADLTSPESVAKKAMGNAGFMDSLVRDVRNGDKEIFRNAEIHNSDGTTTSLMSHEDLARLNGKAVSQMEAEAVRLRALAAVAGEEMMKGHTAPGSANFEDLTKRAEQLVVTTDPQEIARRADIAGKLADHKISVEEARHSTSEHPAVLPSERTSGGGHHATAPESGYVPPTAQTQQGSTKPGPTVVTPTSATVQSSGTPTEPVPPSAQGAKAPEPHTLAKPSSEIALPREPSPLRDAGRVLRSGVPGAISSLLHSGANFNDGLRAIDAFRSAHPEVSLSGDATKSYAALYATAKAEQGMTGGLSQGVGLSHFIDWAEENHIPPHLRQSLNPTDLGLARDGKTVLGRIASYDKKTSVAPGLA